jgi:pyrroloquinoline quinone biosynthesis protein B
MRIVILRGGLGGDAAAASSPDASSRGVTALGTGDGHWVLINVSAAVAQQLGRRPAAAAQAAHAELFSTGVRAVVLTDAQLEHVGGLLGLRNGGSIALYATPAVFEDLTTTLPVLPVLQHYCGVHWHVVPVAGDTRAASFRVEGMPTLEFTALATQMPAPPHSAHHQQPLVGDSIALAVRDRVTGQRVFCAPGLTRISALEFDWMREADCLLVDGQAPGQDSTEPAHAAPSWLELLSGLPARHKVLFAGDDTRGRQSLADHGIELAYDGMEIEL